jgi:hypothetical protein
MWWEPRSAKHFLWVMIFSNSSFIHQVAFDCIAGPGGEHPPKGGAGVEILAARTFTNAAVGTSIVPRRVLSGYSRSPRAALATYYEESSSRHFFSVVLEMAPDLPEVHWLLRPESIVSTIASGQSSENEAPERY